MGWWASEHGVIGDGVADLWGAALDEIRDTIESPTLAGFLHALRTALVDADRTLFSAPLRDANAVIVEFDGAPPMSVSGRVNVGPALAEVIAHAVDETSREYLEDLKRRPSVDELLDVIAFVLAPGGRFDGERRGLMRLTVERR